MNTRLVCPNGHDNLYTVEETTICFSATLERRSDGSISLDYTGDRIVNDEGTEYKQLVYCGSCCQEYAESELLTAPQAAHVNLLSFETSVEEESGLLAGYSPRWRGVCDAAISGDHYSWGCEWEGPWRSADNYVEVVDIQDEEGDEVSVDYADGHVEVMQRSEIPADPAQRAHDAAERDLARHVASFTGESDSPPAPSGEDAGHGTADQEPAPEGAAGVAGGRT